ncbi:MAG: hypothetical protein JNK48_34605 [Bryobacterales bacterium]|nr:hypothetical protein [Bryobacterales bacterium]
MHRILYTLSAVAVLIASLALFSQQGGPTTNPRNELMDGRTAAVRIEFGLRDTEPGDWNGKLSARSGDVLSIRNWRPRPGEQVSMAGWKLRTRAGINFNRRAWEQERLSDPDKYLNLPGIIVDVKGSAATELDIETARGNFTVRPFDLELGSPATRLDGRVRIHRIAPGERISVPEINSDLPAVANLGEGRLITAWVGYREQKTAIFTRDFGPHNWGQLNVLNTGHTDIHQIAAGRDRQRRAVIVWSAQVDGNWDLYASYGSGANWTAPERLTTAPQPDIFPAVAFEAPNTLWLTWQGFRNGKSDIFARSFDGAKWSAEQQISTSTANDWSPAIATGRRGGVYIAWDSYDKGNYDILMRKAAGGQWSEVIPVATTLKYEAAVSLAVDNQNRVWAAWNESGLDWGKDTGFLPRKQGTALYRSRWINVAIHDGQRWMEPEQPFDAVLPASMKEFNDYPTLAADNTGRVWLFFRHRNLRIQDTPSDTPAHRAAWEINATTYEETGWRKLTTLPFTGGRQNMRMGVTVAENALTAVWPMDNRDYEEYLFERADVYAARIPIPAGGQGSLRLKPRVQPDLKIFPTHYEEAKDLARIHGYSLSSGGKQYKIYRGDTHRHTEFSMDGNNDGSLLDTYRYAIDAAELDFMLVSEHNGSAGPDKDYINYLLQQTADIFSVAGKFVPFFGYERSLGYPNGHRNVLFTKRFIPTLPIPPEEQKGQTGAKMLYEYLKKNNGIAISHTSASNMGTDWRDNDPEVEPLVEIYQGDRVSNEYEGAPKAAHAGNPASAPGGFRPAGYVWNAWAKGYKLGVQSASDHLSTHISYACTLAEDFSREGLMEAMKRRHSYGATDNIILDYRMKANKAEYIQGDIVDVKGPFELTVKIIGTQPVRQIDLIRGKEFLMTKNPMQREVEFSFRDTAPVKGESFYYVRVIQADEQMAWSSPIWIKR